MGRLIKQRSISCSPVSCFYKPAGVPLRQLDEVVLSIEELEAMRLADFEGLYQADAASQMGVSRQTIGNTLNSAHKKIADALLNGKALRIEQKERILDAPSSPPPTKGGCRLADSEKD